MFNDTYHEHQEFKEKYKLSESEYREILQLVKFFKEIDDFSLRYNEKLEDVFQRIIKDM